MNIDQVRELVRIAVENGVEKLEVEEGNTRVLVCMASKEHPASKDMHAFSSSADSESAQAGDVLDALDSAEDDTLVAVAAGEELEDAGVSDLDFTSGSLFDVGLDEEVDQEPAVELGYDESVADEFDLTSLDDDFDSESEGASIGSGRPSGWIAVKAPLVGVFRAASAFGEKPYVQAGDRVRAGQTLCSIEALNKRNEVAAEQAGIIREVCLEGAAPVEYGTTLFYLEPLDGEDDSAKPASR